MFCAMTGAWSIESFQSMISSPTLQDVEPIENAAMPPKEPYSATSEVLEAMRETPMSGPLVLFVTWAEAEAVSVAKALRRRMDRSMVRLGIGAGDTSRSRTRRVARNRRKES